jgi:hypothetical protein
MKFLCLIYQDEQQRDAIPAPEWNSLVADCIAADDELRARGVSLGGAALQPARTAATVRHRSGRPSVTDGPFAETKEQLAGYVLIEAPDLETATHVAAALPPGRIGAIEVRPVWEYVDLMERRTA